MTGSEVVVWLSDVSQQARRTRCGGRRVETARDSTAAFGGDASAIGNREHMKEDGIAYTRVVSEDSDSAKRETDEEREHQGVPQLGQPGPAVGPGLARLSRDRSYKAVFHCAEPVEHLVRFVLSDMQQGEEWLQRMDFSTLEPLPTETIDSWLRPGYQDIAWRLRVRATGSGDPEWLRLLILVEFQSTVEYDMPLRMQGYVQRMHELAWKERHVRRTDRLPPVLAVVFYNGARPWRAKRSVWGLTNKRGLRPLDRAVTRMPVGMRYELIDVKQHAKASLSRNNVVELMISTELLGKDLDPEAVHSILEAQGRLLGSQHQRRVLEVLRGWTRLTIARTGVDLEILEDSVKMQEMQRSGTICLCPISQIQGSAIESARDRSK